MACWLSAWRGITHTRAVHLNVYFPTKSGASYLISWGVSHSYVSFDHYSWYTIHLNLTCLWPRSLDISDGVLYELAIRESFSYQVVPYHAIHVTYSSYSIFTIKCPLSWSSYGLPNNAKQGVLICKIVTDINEPYYNHGYGTVTVTHQINITPATFFLYF